jgi:hypothetical protein
MLALLINQEYGRAKWQFLKKNKYQRLLQMMY